MEIQNFSTEMNISWHSNTRCTKLTIQISQKLEMWFMQCKRTNIDKWHRFLKVVPPICASTARNVKGKYTMRSIKPKRQSKSKKDGTFCPAASSEQDEEEASIPRGERSTLSCPNFSLSSRWASSTGLVAHRGSYLDRLTRFSYRGEIRPVSESPMIRSCQPVATII